METMMKSKGIGTTPLMDIFKCYQDTHGDISKEMCNLSSSFPNDTTEGSWISKG